MKSAIISTGFTLLVNPVSNFFTEWNPVLEGVANITVIVAAVYSGVQWVKVAKSYKKQ